MRTALVCVRTPLAAQSIASCAARLGVTTIRTATSEAEALARLTEAPAELIIADTSVSRPDTVGFTKRVLARAPQAMLVMLGPEEPTVAAAAVAAGARGLIRGGDHDLVGTVTKAMLLIGSPRRTAPGEPAAGEPPSAELVGAGVPPVTREVPHRPGAGAAGNGHSGNQQPGVGPAATLLVPAQRGDAPGSAGGRRTALTERELQVLRGMADGKSNAEIGRDLYVSEDTVKTHARRLFRKLRARDRAHAVAVGFRAGALT